MSSKYRDGALTFSCDQPSCHVNHECEPGEFRDGWREAMEYGWVYLPRYEKGISVARHYCPEHAKQFG